MGSEDGSPLAEAGGKREEDTAAREGSIELDRPRARAD